MSYEFPTLIDGHAPCDTPHSFACTDNRAEAMQSVVDGWFDTLSNNFPSPIVNAQVDDWLSMQARVPFASVRNTLLLSVQCPEARRLGTFEYFEANFESHIKQGESALYLFDSIIDKQCPNCEKGAFEHNLSNRYTAPDCTDIPPVSWDTGIIQYSPRPIFDASQLATTDELGRDGPIHIAPLITTSDQYEFDLSANADITPIPTEIPHIASADALVEGFSDIATEMDISFSYVDRESWESTQMVQDSSRDLYSLNPIVRAVDHDDSQRLAGEVLRALAYTDLAYETTATIEMKKRKAEAEAAAYAVALACGHGTHYSLDRFSTPPDIQVWGGDSKADLRERCVRIQSTVATMINAITKVSRKHSTF